MDILKVGTAQPNDQNVGTARLLSYVAELEAENEQLKASMGAADERLRAAAEKCGVAYMGCDTADWMAERIVEQAKSEVGS